MKAQVVAFNWKNGGPSLKLRTDNGLKNFELRVGDDLDLERTGKRKCIGYYHAGKYRKCPLDRSVENYDQCFHCRDLNLFWPCVKCKGEECEASPLVRKRCLNTEHGVYLASFGKKVKVGVTSLSRFRERWLEQGADYALILSKHNGKEARKKENRIAEDFKDKIYFEEKVEEIKNRGENPLDKVIRDGDLDPIGEIRQVFDRYPGLEEVESLEMSKYIKEGEIKAIKGPVLIYEKDGTNFAYNIRNLVAEVIKVDKRKLTKNF